MSMLQLYVSGVVASMTLVVAVLVEDKFWEDFEHCVSREQAIGMCIACFLGFLAYSLLSWFAFANMFYDEYFDR